MAKRMTILNVAPMEIRKGDWLFDGASMELVESVAPGMYPGTRDPAILVSTHKNEPSRGLWLRCSESFRIARKAV
jgi:hypothetical protein